MYQRYHHFVHFRGRQPTDKTFYFCLFEEKTCFQKRQVFRFGIFNGRMNVFFRFILRKISRLLFWKCQPVLFFSFILSTGYISIKLLSLNYLPFIVPVPTRVSIFRPSVSHFSLLSICQSSIEVCKLYKLCHLTDFEALIV